MVESVSRAAVSDFAFGRNDLVVGARWTRPSTMTNSSYDTPVLDTYHAVVSAFSDFLTVAIHTVLYERDIYPRTSFLSARKYNYPVKQSRHPKVCKWIQDAVAAVGSEMLKVGYS